MKLKAVSGIILSLLLVGMLTLAFDIQPVKANETYVSVDPTENAVILGDTLTINITVTNVTNLFAWQIKLYFDPSVLSFEKAWLPTGPTVGEEHVFYGKGIVGVMPFEGSDENGTYVMYGCTHLF